MQVILFLVRNKKYSISEQYASLHAHFTQNAYVQWMHDGFTWYCDVTPSELSDTYTLKVVYRQFGFPEVYVVKPKPLKLADGAKRLPHTYDSNRQKLCLFYPLYNEWDRTKLLSNTIMHWAIRWLYYYEEWAYSGKWKGGGHGNHDAVFQE